MSLLILIVSLAKKRISHRMEHIFNSFLCLKCFESPLYRNSQDIMPMIIIMIQTLMKPMICTVIMRQRVIQKSHIHTLISRFVMNMIMRQILDRLLSIFLIVRNPSSSLRRLPEWTHRILISLFLVIFSHFQGIEKFQQSILMQNACL